jgi:hypothetical protein
MVHVSSARKGGLASVRMDERRPAAAGRETARRRYHAPATRVVLRADPDVNVGAKGTGDLLRDERPERPPGDAPHDLADEEPLPERVVPRRRTGLPPRRSSPLH